MSRNQAPFRSALAVGCIGLAVLGGCAGRVLSPPAQPTAGTVSTQPDSLPPRDAAPLAPTVASRDTLTSVQLGSQAWQIAEAEHNRAHWQLLQMNERIQNEMMHQFRAAHCPPSDVFSAPLDHDAQARRAKLQSVRGKIFFCDDSPRARFALLRASGRSIALVGDTTVVARMVGLEVTLSGELSSSGQRRWPRLDVKRAIVHGRDGRPAWDGILRREAGRDYLELTSGGRLAIPRLPENLEGANGLRVWIVGPLGDPGGGGVVSPSANFR